MRARVCVACMQMVHTYAVEVAANRAFTFIDQNRRLFISAISARLA